MAIDGFKSLISHVVDNTILSTDYFGEAVTYTAPDGLTTSLTAIVGEEETETPDESGIATKLRVRECSWSTSQLSDVNLKSMITIGSEDWSVARVVSQDDYQITVRLERHELRSHTRPDFRRGS